MYTDIVGILDVMNNNSFQSQLDPRRDGNGGGRFLRYSILRNPRDSHRPPRKEGRYPKKEIEMMVVGTIHRCISPSLHLFMVEPPRVPVCGVPSATQTAHARASSATAYSIHISVFKTEHQLEERNRHATVTVTE